jgi:hypothetical protein
MVCDRRHRRHLWSVIINRPCIVRMAGTEWGAATFPENSYLPASLLVLNCSAITPLAPNWGLCTAMFTVVLG